MDFIEKKSSIIIFLLLITISSLFINGYSFGDSDHSLTIPIIKYYADKTLYPNDLPTTQFDHYYTFLWIFISSLSNLINLDVLFFLLYFISLFLTFLLIFYLSKLIFKNNYVNYIAVLLFLVAKPTLAVNSLDSQLVARGLALPFLLFSLYLFLKEKYNWAFLIVGISALIHAMSAFLLIFLYLFYYLVRFKNIEKSKILSSVILFIIASLPIFIWKFITKSSLTLFSVDPVWLELLKLRSAHHIFPLSFSLFNWLIMFIVIIGFILALRYKKKDKMYKMIIAFSFASIILCLIGFIFTEIIPLSIILNLQLFRVAEFFFVFALIYIANYIYNLYTKNFIGKILAIALFSILFWSNIYVIVCVFTTVSLIMLLTRFNKKFIIAGLLLFLILISIGGMYKGVEINFNGKNDWQDMQLWCKDNAEGILITLPYEYGFRVFSEKSIVGDWKDGTLLNFDPEFGKKWFDRMKDLNCLSEEACKEGYNSLTENSFIELGKKYNSKYVVVEKPKELNFELQYENKKYRIYSI